MNVIIISLFTSMILLEEINISARIKLFLKIKLSKQVKVIDCLPCFTFWISVILCVTLHENIIYSLATFIIAKFYEAWTSNR